MMRKTTHKNYKNAFFLAAATKCRYMHQTYKFRHFYELKHNTKLPILMLSTNVKIIRKQKIENFDKKTISFQVITFRRYHFPPMHLNIF